MDFNAVVDVLNRDVGNHLLRNRRLQNTVDAVSFFPLSLFIPGDLVTVLNQKIAQRNMRTFLFRAEFKRCSKFFSFRFCGKRFFAFYCCRNTTEPVMYRIELLKLTALMLSCTRYDGAAHLPIQRHYYRH